MNENLLLGQSQNFFLSFSDSFKAYFAGFSWSNQLLTILDLAVVALLIYFALVFIRGTKASKIVYGIALLLAIALIGQLLRLETLNWLLGHLATLVVVAIPVVFQPELRRALERLGRTRILRQSPALGSSTLAPEIREVIEALRILKANNVGALLVFERRTGLGDYQESGIKLEARISAKLLLNLFFPNSPLHDGAVIIRQGKIAAAACLLPLADTKDTYVYGTRHRAALGVTENTDALALVVSEERGKISFVKEGKIEEDLDFLELEKKLTDSLKK